MRNTSRWFRRRSLMMLAALVGSALVGAVLTSNSASAAEDEGYGSNLSVPAIFLPGSTATDAPALRGGACGNAILPTGSTSTQFPGYYIQKSESMWQAQCANADAVNVVANWGDNLTSRPKVSSRQPIRVEVGLDYTPATPMKGFVVEKLTPDAEDRVATYGTTGALVDFTTARVFDSGARLRIERVDGPGGVVYDGPMSAEINSTGAVVYGYNWGVKGKSGRALPGTYKLTYTLNRATFIGVDAGDVAKASYTPKTTSLMLTVSATTGVKGKPGSGSGSSGGGSSGGSGSHGGGSSGGSGSHGSEHGSGGHRR